MNRLYVVFLIMSLVLILYGCGTTTDPSNQAAIEKQVYVSEEKMVLDSETDLTTEIVLISSEGASRSLHNALVFRLPALPYELNNISAPYYLYLLITNIDPNNPKHKAIFEAYWANVKSFSEVKSVADLTEQTLIPFVLPVTKVEETITADMLMRNYNIPVALTIRALLGESYKDETIMIVGSEVPLKLNFSSSVDTSKISVIALSNYNQAEITQAICKVNKVVFNETYIGSLTKKLRDEHINRHIRSFNHFLTNLGSLLTPRTAYASDRC